MRIRQVLVFALVAAFTVVGVAHAAKTTPVWVVNPYINTTAEQISSSAGTACKKAKICNRDQGQAAYVRNNSSVATTTGIKLWPNAGTAPVDSMCIDLSPVQIGSTITTVDMTTWYAIAATGNVSIGILCIP